MEDLLYLLLAFGLLKEINRLHLSKDKDKRTDLKFCVFTLFLHLHTNGNSLMKNHSVRHKSKQYVL